MTLRFKEWHDQYEAHDSAGTAYAKATNEMFSTMWDIPRQYGLKMPNNDMAEDIVALIFVTVYDFNNKEKK